MLVTAGYVSLGALYSSYLTLTVASTRNRLRVSLGDGSREMMVEILDKLAINGNSVLRDPKIVSSPFHSKYYPLMRNARAHGNFVEQSLVAWALIGFAELNGMPKPMVHTLLATFSIARLIHTRSILKDKTASGPMRFVSMLVTIGVLVIGSGWNLWTLFTS